MNLVKKKAFLVFSGGNDRAILGFLRALRLCGEHALIIARTSDDPILETDFRGDVKWVRPTHELSLDIVQKCIEKARESAKDQTLVILPSTEYLNTFLLEHRPQMEMLGCEIPLVAASLYAELTGKHTAARFFAAAGIKAPSELDPYGGLRSPLVAKPRVNVSISGKTLYPHLLESDAELDAFVRANDPREYFFQEFVGGDSVYLLFYMARDGHEYLWSQRNLLQQPGGKSMLLAEAADFHQSVTAKRIIQALRAVDFHGIGMVEIIRSGGSEFFIEMNPRIWGPVQFCLDQKQPLLQAFIGESLYGRSTHFLIRKPKRRRKRYFWFGGVLETLCAGKRPTWHAKDRSLLLALLTNIAFDIYLRRDSWRCFLSSLRRAANAKSHHE